MWYAGIDWATPCYQILVMNDVEVPVGSLCVLHTSEGLSELIDFLSTFVSESREQIACIIPSSNGVLRSLLLDAGFIVYVVGSRGIKHFRDTIEVKDDANNAYLLAKLGCTRLADLPKINSNGTLTDGKSEYMRLRDIPSVAQQNYIKQKQSELQAQHRLFWHGSVNRPEIALTFDDGPHPLYTLQILDVLKQFKVQATFFCIGLQVQSYPGIVERTHREGHIVGNHTWSHPYLSSLSSSDITRQLTTSTEIIQKVIGMPPTFFRPPYGDYNITTLAHVKAQKMITAMWSIDPNDWACPGTHAIVESILDQVKNGSIILLHDGGRERFQTVKALPSILEQLLLHNFHFVTLSQLVGRFHTN